MEEILVALNEWWKDGVISKEKAKEYKRKIFENIKKTFFDYRQILLLTGLRRVGKTTLMFQLIEELLKNVEPKNILYFSFDEKVEDPIKILESYSKITKVDWKKEKVYLFFDEIQKLKNWSSKIKILYDNFPNLKFCLSGSASLMIESEAIKNLVGRFFLEEIRPLTLQEFCELYFEKKIDSFDIYRSEIERVLEEYFFKPFPEIVKWKDKIKIREYIRELVLERITKSDIPSIFNSINLSLISSLTEILLKDIGSIINIDSLSKELKVSKITLINHLKYLEFGNIIRFVKNFRPSIRAESRKLKKVYPYHVSLSLSIHSNLEKSKIIESLVQSSLKLDKYWRKNGKEIDFLRVEEEIIPIEVKAKEEIRKEDLNALVYFMKKHNVERGYIVYLGTEKRIEMGKKEIFLKPLSELLFDFSI